MEQVKQQYLMLLQEFILLQVERFFKGKDVTGKQPYDLAKVGITRTFQNIRLFNDLTVLDNVENWRALTGSC